MIIRFGKLCGGFIRSVNRSNFRRVNRLSVKSCTVGSPLGISGTIGADELLSEVLSVPKLVVEDEFSLDDELLSDGELTLLHPLKTVDARTISAEKTEAETLDFIISPHS